LLPVIDSNMAGSPKHILTPLFLTSLCIWHFNLSRT
jgi:hypothetical protein